MIYLKRIVVWLEGKEHQGDAERLAERMREAGVACGIRLSARTDDIGRQLEGKAAHGPEGENAFQEEIAETLYVTDVSCVARRLVEGGCAVLAFLHEGNRDEDFSVCRYACESLADLDAEYLDRIYRRYRRLPWDILETERCLVRETTEEDVEDFYRIYSEPSITEYMEGLFEDPDEELAYARDYIDQVYSFYNFGIWTVVEKSAGEVIGRAGICYREGYEDPEIGFVIAKEWQGQGIACEVCRAVLRYAREELGFSRVLAFVRPENEISVHICEKLGLEIKNL